MNLTKTTLDKLGFVGRGRSRHRPRNDESLFGGEYPFIQTGEVRAANLYISSFNSTYNEKGLKQSKLWEENTLLITIAANIADTAILKIKACFPDSIVAFIPHENVSDVFYVKYYLDFIQMELKAISQGTTQDNMSLDKLLSKPIYVHTYPAQKKIASILCTYDNLIENNTQRIRLLEEMAAEIYKEWFLLFRFPNYENTKFFDKEAKEVTHGTKGALPEGWSILKLRECLSHYIGGGWGEEEAQGKNNIPAYVIRGTDFPDFNAGKLNFEVLRYHTKSNLSSRVCKPDDLIFEVSGGTESQSLGRTCFLSKNALERFDQPVICASFCKLIRVDNSKISPYYINEMLNRMYNTGELMIYQVQSTGISNYQFEDFIEATKVIIPTKEIQQKFERIVKPMYEEIQTLGEKNEILQETRDLLLPRLISGKLSVEDLKIEQMNMAVEPQLNY